MPDTISTDAWILSHPEGAKQPKFARGTFRINPPQPDEVLVEPLYGSWEGNMGHALTGSPVNLCMSRNEPEIVLGNSGVVRVLRTGSGVEDLREGDHCLVFCAGEIDAAGYPISIMGYDCAGSMGVLAKHAIMKRRQLICLPKENKIPLESWAAFSLRYISAYANWKIALGAWKLQMATVPAAECHVVAWGGGVSLAELELAVSEGCKATLITSKVKHQIAAEKTGIGSVNRNNKDMTVLSALMEETMGRGASIIIDNVGSDFRTTLRALARQGVIATCGWREGMNFAFSRASECINRHIHVHTHYAKYQEGEEAVAIAQARHWYPRITHPVWKWEEIDELSRAYHAGEIEDYFPVFNINS